MYYINLQRGSLGLDNKTAKNILLELLVVSDYSGLQLVFAGKTIPAPHETDHSQVADWVHSGSD